MKLKYNQETINTVLQNLDKLTVQGIQNNAIIVEVYNILTQQCEQIEEAEENTEK